MDWKEYVKKKIKLTGYGTVDEMELDNIFFKAQEKEFGKIKEVYEIDKGIGGNIIGDFCGEGPQGCVILFKSGQIMVIESDDEYIDWFTTNKE